MSADAIEREVQRRLTDRLAAAGVPEGQLSLQVLFMLPSDFVRAYTQLFLAALKESPSSAQPEVKKPIPRDWRGRAPMTTGGAKRYRTHWVVKSEKAFRAKQSVDRKLRRLVAAIEAKESPEKLRCRGCQFDLIATLDTIGFELQHCPRCGDKIKRGKPRPK